MVRCLDVGFKQKKRPLHNHRCMKAFSPPLPLNQGARQDSIIFTDKRRINWRSGI